MSENNDDLQNAINGIVNGAADGAADDTTATDDVATPDLGVAPAPAMPEDAPAEMSLPTMAVPDPEAGLMNSAPEAIEDQATEAVNVPEPIEEPEPVETGVSASVSSTVGISDMKKNMIKDLIPLMDKVQLSAEKQFGFYKEIIDATHDTSMVPAAYEVAKGLADDAARAEALLYLIDLSE